MRQLVKEFSYDGCNYYFDTLRFREVVKKRLEKLRDKGNKISRQELFETIAEEKGLSSSSLNHWYNGHNAPNEIEKVQDVADVLEVDWRIILKKEQDSEGEMKMINGEMIQKVEAKGELPSKSRDIDYSVEINVIRDIYHAMIDFIEEFRDTTAFQYDDGTPIDYVQINAVEILDVMYEADKKCRAILIKIKKAMLDIPYEVYHNLRLFTDGYLSSCLGDEVADIWDIGTFTDEELIAMGHDLSEMNPYGRKFEGYTTYCKKHNMEDDINTRMQYVNAIADNAYAILEEILQQYIKK